MQNRTRIPWSTPEEWHQVVRSLDHLTRLHRQRLGSAEQTASDILEKISCLSGFIQPICARTCTECSDICCKHALIWYDFKDLLTIHLARRPFPAAQLKKENGGRENGDNSRACSLFLTEGCRVNRMDRPFICTWYFCPEQTRWLGKYAPDKKEQIDKTIKQIKEKRALLENQFIEATF